MLLEFRLKMQRKPKALKEIILQGISMEIPLASFQYRLCNFIHTRILQTFKSNVFKILDQLWAIDMRHFRTNSRDPVAEFQMHIVQCVCKSICGISYKVDERLLHVATLRGNSKRRITESSFVCRFRPICRLKLAPNWVCQIFAFITQLNALRQY